MYAGRVACCPPVSHGEYADRTDARTDGRTDGRQTVAFLRFPLDAASVKFIQTARRTAPRRATRLGAVWRGSAPRSAALRSTASQYYVNICKFHAKRLLDPTSRLATIHQRYRQTDEQDIRLHAASVTQTIAC